VATAGRRDLKDVYYAAVIGDEEWQELKRLSNPEDQS